MKFTVRHLSVIFKTLRRPSVYSILHPSVILPQRILFLALFSENQGFVQLSSTATHYRLWIGTKFKIKEVNISTMSPFKEWVALTVIDNY